MEKVTQSEWLERGKELFGSVLDWEFVCPSCGHIQKPKDFLPFKDEEEAVHLAYSACIGRYDGHMENSGSGKQPCNYTSFGLLNINPVEVTMGPDGSETVRAFAFNEGK